MDAVSTYNNIEKQLFDMRTVVDNLEGIIEDLNLKGPTLDLSSVLLTGPGLLQELNEVVLGLDDPSSSEEFCQKFGYPIGSVPSNPTIRHLSPDHQTLLMTQVATELSRRGMEEDVANLIIRLTTDDPVVVLASFITKEDLRTIEEVELKLFKKTFKSMPESARYSKIIYKLITKL